MAPPHSKNQQNSLLLLSAHIKRFSVSRVRVFSSLNANFSAYMYISNHINEEISAYIEQITINQRIADCL